MTDTPAEKTDPPKAPTEGVPQQQDQDTPQQANNPPEVQPLTGATNIVVRSRRRPS